MDFFWKTTAVALIAVILALAIGKQEKDLSILLTMATCCMGAVAAVTFLKPVLDLLWELEAMAQLKDGVLGILLKCSGIVLVAELAGMICSDAGNASLAKMLQMLGSATVLYLSIPVITSLLALIRRILGDL